VSSIFCEAGNGTVDGPSGTGTGKSSYLGSYEIIDEGLGVYTHTLNFPEQHPCMYEYKGTIDGPKTKVFSFDFPGDQYRIHKYSPYQLRLDDLRATCATPLSGTIPSGGTAYAAGTGLIPSGCVAFYNLDNTTAKVGTVNLINNGGVTFSAGKVGNAAVFTGNNSLSLQGQPGYPYPYLSISAWVKTSSTGEVSIISSVGAAYQSGYTLELNNGNVVFTTYFGSSTDKLSVTSTTRVNDNSWHHIVAEYIAQGTDGFVIYDHGFINIYIDGVFNVKLDHTDTRSVDGARGNNTVIGANSSGNGLFFTGSIDSLGIWTRELDVSDIVQLYNTTIGLEPV
jgi:hypothetical protein